MGVQLASSAQVLVTTRSEWSEVSSRQRQLKGTPSAGAASCHLGVRTRAAREGLVLLVAGPHPGESSSPLVSPTRSQEHCCLGTSDGCSVTPLGGRPGPRRSVLWEGGQQTALVAPSRAPWARPSIPAPWVLRRTRPGPRRGRGGARAWTAAAPTFSLCHFESLVSFLFGGVILRTRCHQRVEGQG